MTTQDQHPINNLIVQDDNPASVLFLAVYGLALSSRSALSIRICY